MSALLTFLLIFWADGMIRCPIFISAVRPEVRIPNPTLRRISHSHAHRWPRASGRIRIEDCGRRNGSWDVLSSLSLSRPSVDQWKTNPSSSNLKPFDSKRLHKVSAGGLDGHPAWHHRPSPPCPRAPTIVGFDLATNQSCADPSTLIKLPTLHSPPKWLVASFHTLDTFLLNPIPLFIALRHHP